MVEQLSAWTRNRLAHLLDNFFWYFAAGIHNFADLLTEKQ
jgi:hypothetical protein